MWDMHMQTKCSYKMPIFEKDKGSLFFKKEKKIV